MIEDEIDPLRTPLLDHDAEDEEQLVVGEVEESTSESDSQHEEEGDSEPPFWYRALHTPLLPDHELVVRGNQVLEGAFSIKLFKFLLLTFGSVFFLHWLVSFRANHRDADLKVWQLWVFDGNLMVGDAVAFFVVGRLWQQQRGVDHLAWIATMVLANLFFESQHYIPFLRHSFTLYEIHCVWPWQLWLFAGLIIPLILAVVVAHGIRAYRDKILWMKLIELGLCVLFFVAPVVTSPYFHFHHWFAGWLLGMHCNVDVWWSRMAMAWCWGMYINGIAVYGRDPVLTCEYAYFLTVDLRCPYVDNCPVEGDKDPLYGATALMQLLVGDLEPADWRNCSASGYHP
jgi:hypothetical protein